MDDGTSRAGRRNAFGVIAGALFVIGPALAWLRIVPGIAGFGLFALGGMVGLVAGVASVVQAARGRGLGRGGALAVAVGAVFLALASRGVGKPTSAKRSASTRRAAPCRGTRWNRSAPASRRPGPRRPSTACSIC